MPIYLTRDRDNPDGRPYHISNGDFGRGKFFAKPKNIGRAVIKVAPCINHDSPVATVPVIIADWNPVTKTRKIVANGSACPICWEILKSPGKAP